MKGRLFEYTTNLSKVNEMIEDKKVEFETIARWYITEIERLENAMKGGEGGKGGVKKKRRAPPSALTQHSVRSGSISDLDCSDLLQIKVSSSKPIDTHVSSSNASSANNTCGIDNLGISDSTDELD